jgi:hypothetical protein
MLAGAAEVGRRVGSSAGRALEDVRRERAGLDAPLSPVVQAAADLIEPVAKSVDDRLLLLVGALLDAAAGHVPHR